MNFRYSLIWNVDVQYTGTQMPLTNTCILWNQKQKMVLRRKKKEFHIQSIQGTNNM